MFGRELSTEDRIRRQRVTIMSDERFIALTGILNMGSLNIVDKPGFTAATNGRDEAYGKDFVASLPDKELRFLVLHECYHKLYRHLTTWEHLTKDNAKLANIAMDFVVNGMLDKEAGLVADNFVVMPGTAAGKPNGWLDHKFDGMDVGAVYKALKQMAEDGDGGASGEGMDEHDYDGSSGLPDLSEEDVKELASQVDTAIRQGVYLAGKQAGEQDRKFDGLLEAAIPWQEVLQDFVTTHSVGRDMSTWRRPNRRWLARDMYMPSQYSESTKRITIGIDTSGSISDRDIRVFLTETKAAFESASPEIVDIIYWDTRVAAHETYEGVEIASFDESTKPAGGGGTMVGAMREYMIEQQIKPDCIIMFTDGYVEADWGGPDWPAPVLWGITTNIVAPFGKTLRVKL